MHLYQHWARADGVAARRGDDDLAFSVARGSDASLADAERRADDAAARLVARTAEGRGFEGAGFDAGQYPYPTSSPREEVLLARRGPGGELRAAVTRNRYGAKVLNCADLLVIDVDFDRLASPLVSWWRRAVRPALGLSHRAPYDPAGGPLARLARWISGHPEWAVRAYRTAMGLRYLVTHEPFEPGGLAAEVAITELGCDREYMKLCRGQRSFRARLTPKPWRVGGRRPVGAPFPWRDAAEEARAREWEAAYASACVGLAACEFLGAWGAGGVADGLADLVALHDAEAGAHLGLPLA